MYNRKTFGGALRDAEQPSRRENHIGKISTVGDGGKSISITNMNNSQLRDLMTIAPYGIASSPPLGLMAYVIVSEHSNRDGMIGVYDPNKPLVDPGDSILYSRGGAYVHCKDKRVIINGIDIIHEINSGSGDIKIPVASSSTLGGIIIGDGLEIDESGKVRMCKEQVIPIGSIIEWIATDPPTDWLLLDGQEVSRMDYPELFRLIGTTYGEGDGSTTFNLPDYSGRVPVGRDINDTNFSEIGSKGGSKDAVVVEHNHTQNSHNHTQDSHNHTQNSHTHTQNSHNHIQDSHNHTQNSHNHTSYRYIASKLASGSTGARVYSPGTSVDGTTAVSSGSKTATNQATTATNQATTATNQATTATNKATTATNKATTATNQATTATNQATTATNNATGVSGTDKNLQPYITVNFIIKAK